MSHVTRINTKLDDRYLAFLIDSRFQSLTMKSIGRYKPRVDGKAMKSKRVILFRWRKTTYLSRKWFRTHITTMRRISGMLTEMIIEVFFPSERPLTKFTSVRRFASVDSYMIRQVLLTSK